MNQPERKSTSPWVYVGCGCGAIVLAVIAFVAFLIFVVFAAIRSSDPFRDGVARARADARVIEALGAPIEPGWFVSGSIQRKNDGGTCDIHVRLNGSKQSGSLHVVGLRNAGRWTYTTMTVTPAEGPPIDVLRGSPNTAPPGD